MQPSLSGPTICTTVRMEGRSYPSRQEGGLRFASVFYMLHIGNRDGADFRFVKGRCHL